MAHQAKVIHHIKGRMRLKVETAKNRPHALERLRKRLSELPDVHSSQASSLTGSILLKYDSKSHNTFFERVKAVGEESGLFNLSDIGSSEVEEITRDICTEADYLATRSKTAAVLVDEIKRANLNVKMASGNLVDLNVLLPLGLALSSVLTVGLSAGTPLWVTLAISSFHSFVSLQARAPKTPQAEPNQHVSGHTSQ